MVLQSPKKVSGKPAALPTQSLPVKVGGGVVMVGAAVPVGVAALPGVLGPERGRTAGEVVGGSVGNTCESPILPLTHFWTS